jgi:hypothetical protein
VPNITFGFSGGYVSSRDRSDLQPGELQTADEVYYKPGDPSRIWRLPGRSEFMDTASAARILGIALCKFDSGGSDRVVALSGTTLYGGTPGTTATPVTLASGLSASTTTLVPAHYADRWYLATGYDRMRVLENDGTVRPAWMVGPVVPPTCVASNGTAPTYPTASTGSFTSPANAYDADTATFSYASLSAAGSTTHTWTTWSSDSAATRRLEVRYRLAGLPINDDTDRSVGVGGVIDSGYLVTVLLEYSVDGGSNFSTLVNATRRGANGTDVTAQVPLTANSNLIHFRATLTYTSGTSQATLRIVEIKIQAGGGGAAVTTGTGMYYAFTEYDATRGLESPPSPQSAIVDLAAQNTVTLTLPAAAQNSTATHWRIYRTPDEGVVPTQLGFIGAALIAQTTFVDALALPVTLQSRPIVPLRTITGGDDEGDTTVPRDTPPPALSFVTAWKGALCGLRIDSPRELSYSDPGRPESWPEFYRITSFPLPERDELVALVPIGDTMLILAKEAALVLTDLPLVVSGVFNAAEATPLRAAKGCVGRYAACAYSVAGESRAAWVSTFGVYSTNGSTVVPLSDDLDWPNEVSVSDLGSSVLLWDQELRVLRLWVDADGDGVNDRQFLFHMSPEHQKDQGPKITLGEATTSCAVGGVVDDTWHLYTGHVSDGTVNLEGGEENTATMRIKPGMIYGEWSDWQAIKGNLRHTDFGDGEECSVAWTWGRDVTGNTGTVTKAVSLEGHIGTEFFVNRSGEWAELEIVYEGSGLGSIQDCRVSVLPLGKSGKKF